MKLNKSLTHAANGIQAANMIHKLGYRKSSKSNVSLNLSNASTLVEILNVLSEHAPEYHKALLSQTVASSKRYLDAYKGLKQHYSDNVNRAFRKEDLITTLNIVKPILGKERTAMVEKFLKIYEVLYLGL